MPYTNQNKCLTFELHDRKFIYFNEKLIVELWSYRKKIKNPYSKIIDILTTNGGMSYRGSSIRSNPENFDTIKQELQNLFSITI